VACCGPSGERSEGGHGRSRHFDLGQPWIERPALASLRGSDGTVALSHPHLRPRTNERAGPAWFRAHFGRTKKQNTGRQIKNQGARRHRRGLQKTISRLDSCRRLWVGGVPKKAKRNPLCATSLCVVVHRSGKAYWRREYVGGTAGAPPRGCVPLILPRTSSLYRAIRPAECGAWPAQLSPLPKDLGLQDDALLRRAAARPAVQCEQFDDEASRKSWRSWPTVARRCRAPCEISCLCLLAANAEPRALMQHQSWGAAQGFGACARECGRSLGTRTLWQGLSWRANERLRMRFLQRTWFFNSCRLALTITRARSLSLDHMSN